MCGIGAAAAECGGDGPGTAEGRESAWWRPADVLKEADARLLLSRSLRWHPKRVGAWYGSPSWCLVPGISPLSHSIQSASVTGAALPVSAGAVSPAATVLLLSAFALSAGPVLPLRFFSVLSQPAATALLLSPFARMGVGPRSDPAFLSCLRCLTEGGGGTFDRPVFGIQRAFVNCARGYMILLCTHVRV